MAEVFGAVASGIGIAGVAAQAIDGIRKLQAFCNDIRDAPVEVKYLTAELEILLGTIASIEAQIQRNSTVCGNMDPTPALRFVDQSVRSLNAVIEKLNIEIAQKRKLGSMKMAWKKKVLESHLMKIERSKTSLGLAVSAYSTELYLQTATRTDTKIDQLSMDVTTLIGNNQQIRADEDDHCRRIRKKPRSSRSTSVLSFSLVLPSWLAQHSLQVNLSRAAQSWNLSLRPYRTIPHDAEIWDAVGWGNFDKMRSLIESGQATVFDRRGDGTTLLHQVCTRGPPLAPEVFSRMARYLVDRGADANEPMDRGWLAIHTHFYGERLLIDLPNDDFFRILSDEGDLDADFFWQKFRDDSGFTYSATIEEELKRRFPLDALDFPKMTMARRMRDIQSYPYLCSPQEVASYLGFESFEVSYPTLSDDLKRELLRLALNKWGFTSGERNIASEEWQSTVRGLLALGVKIQLLGSGDEKGEEQEGTEGRAVRDEAVVEVIRSFVIEYIWGKTWPGPLEKDARDIVEGFEYFISKTEYLGIRFEPSSFCRRFELCVDYGFLFSTDTSDAGSEGWWIPREFCLYYDDDLSTWVMWDSMYETYCGEFWDLIDHPERTMPGTWIE